MVPSSVPPASPPAGRRRVWPLVVAVLVAVLVAGTLIVAPWRSEQRKPWPAEQRAPRPAEQRAPWPGFGEGTLKVLVVASGSDRSPAEHCSLLAATAAQRARGLMTRTGLGGYASMVFRFDEDVESAFYNRNVPIALTVAWFDAQGRWVGSKDLEPCPDFDSCPTVAPGAPYRYAVEVEKGGLARLGLGPGSQISFSEGC